MSRRRVVLFTLLGPPLCGVLVACSVLAAWLVVGRPQLANGREWFQIEQVGQVHYSGSPADPIFFLVVGGDDRAGGPGGRRGDSVHVIGVNPHTGGATVMGIPRDTEVNIPGHGSDKINAALQYGGLDLMVETVKNLTGVPISYAVSTNFDGLIAMVDELGGIDVVVPAPMHDQFSGTNFNPGPAHLSGDQALRFSRDRHSFPTGDLARSGNQGLLIISALATLQNQNTGAGGVLHAIGVLSRHTEVKNMSLVDLYRLGRLALLLKPETIRNVVIPTGGGSGSNLSVGAGADSLFADVRDDGQLQSH